MDSLERAGHVERVPDPADGRARLTARGGAVLPLARAEEQRIEAEWEEFLGSRRMAHLRDALTRLRTITELYADD